MTDESSLEMASLLQIVWVPLLFSFGKTIFDFEFLSELPSARWISQTVSKRAIHCTCICIYFFVAKFRLCFRGFIRLSAVLSAKCFQCKRMAVQLKGFRKRMVDKTTDKRIVPRKHSNSNL